MSIFYNVFINLNKKLKNLFRHNKLSAKQVLTLVLTVSLVLVPFSQVNLASAGLISLGGSHLGNHKEDIVIKHYFNGDNEELVVQPLFKKWISNVDISNATLSVSVDGVDHNDPMDIKLENDSIIRKVDIDPTTDSLIIIKVKAITHGGEIEAYKILDRVNDGYEEFNPEGKFSFAFTDDNVDKKLHLLATDTKYETLIKEVRNIQNDSEIFLDNEEFVSSTDYNESQRIDPKITFIDGQTVSVPELEFVEGNLADGDFIGSIFHRYDADTKTLDLAMLKLGQVADGKFKVYFDGDLDNKAGAAGLSSGLFSLPLNGAEPNLITVVYDDSTYLYLEKLPEGNYQSFKPAHKFKLAFTDDNGGKKLHLLATDTKYEVLVEGVDMNGGNDDKFYIGGQVNSTIDYAPGYKDGADIIANIKLIGGESISTNTLTFNGDDLDDATNPKDIIFHRYDAGTKTFDLAMLKQGEVDNDKFEVYFDGKEANQAAGEPLANGLLSLDFNALNNENLPYLISIQYDDSEWLNLQFIHDTYQVLEPSDFEELLTFSHLISFADLENSISISQYNTLLQGNTAMLQAVKSVDILCISPEADLGNIGFKNMNPSDGSRVSITNNVFASISKESLQEKCSGVSTDIEYLLIGLDVEFNFKHKEQLDYYLPNDAGANHHDPEEYIKLYIDYPYVVVTNNPVNTLPKRNAPNKNMNLLAPDPGDPAPPLLILDPQAKTDFQIDLDISGLFEAKLAMMAVIPGKSTSPNTQETMSNILKILTGEVNPLALKDLQYFFMMPFEDPEDDISLSFNWDSDICIDYNSFIKGMSILEYGEIVVPNVEFIVGPEAAGLLEALLFYEMVLEINIIEKLNILDRDDPVINTFVLENVLLEVIQPEIEKIERDMQGFRANPCEVGDYTVFLLLAGDEKELEYNLWSQAFDVKVVGPQNRNISGSKTNICEKHFSDYDELTKDEQEIACSLFELGILTGKPDPDNPDKFRLALQDITNRSESFAILHRLKPSEFNQSDYQYLQRFIDLQEALGNTESTWYLEPLSVLVKLGVVRGYGDGTIRPAQDMSQVEVAKVIAELLLTKNGQPFKNNDALEPWFTDTVDLYQSLGMTLTNIPATRRFMLNLIYLSLQQEENNSQKAKQIR